jgi:hypothetical protein
MSKDLSRRALMAGAAALTPAIATLPAASAFPDSDARAASPLGGIPRPGRGERGCAGQFLSAATRARS